MSARAYPRLEDRFRRVLVLGDAARVLDWDTATMMPPGGARARAEQLAVLKAVQHATLIHPETEELLAAAEAEDLDPWQRANLREMRRRWSHAAALDETLVVALSEAGSACEMAWREAKPRADFSRVLPAFRTLLARVREAAARKGERLGLDPYDALLDAYEPAGRSAAIEPLFADLARFLPEALARAMDRQARRPAPRPPKGPFAVARQRELAVRVLATLGFDFDHGRLDESRHPFCGGVPEDVRITTRFDADDFTKGLMAVLHEAGHALYERGLPARWRHQPVGRARSMGLHESQSLLIEMQIGRSRPFLEFLAPVVRESLGGDADDFDPDNLYRLLVQAEPGFVRVDADEITYPLHVILRFRLETALIAGALEADDLPEAWNRGMGELLGITPPDDRLGCLQDLHWYDGGFGYFPSYTLGALAAAQIFEAARTDDPAILPAIGRGDLKPLRAWLAVHVHGKGSLMSSADLLTAATGRALNADAFKRHIRERYLD